MKVRAHRGAAVCAEALITGGCAKALEVGRRCEAAQWSVMRGSTGEEVEVYGTKERPSGRQGPHLRRRRGGSREAQTSCEVDEVDWVLSVRTLVTGRESERRMPRFPIARRKTALRRLEKGVALKRKRTSPLGSPWWNTAESSRKWVARRL